MSLLPAQPPAPPPWARDPQPAPPPVAPLLGVAVLLGVTAVTGWWSLRTGDPWLLLVACCVAAPAVVAYLWRPRLQDLDVHGSAPHRAVAGETVEQVLEALNSGRRATPGITLTYAVRGYDDLVVTVPALPPGGSARLAVPRRATTRGADDVHHLTLTTTAPFGLVERRRTLAVRGSLVVVHPRHARSFEVPTRGGPGGDEPSGRPARTGPDVHGTREWRVGDEARQVHWRSTARHGRLVVVDPEEVLARRLALVVAGRADARVWEELVARCASTVRDALLDGRQVLLLAEDPRCPPTVAPGIAQAMDWFAMLAAPAAPSPQLLGRAARWAGPDGVVAVGATDRYLGAAVAGVAEAARTGTDPARQGPVVLVPPAPPRPPRPVPPPRPAQLDVPG